MRRIIMSIQFANVGGAVIIPTKRKIITNGISYDMPKGMKGNNSTIINDKIYIDGFELVDGEWKRTLKALWYKIF
jgi:hypothetical protein